MREQYRSQQEILELFEELGVVYLRRPEFEYERLHSFVPAETGYYRANSEEFEELTARYGEAIRQGRIAPVVIRRAGEMGLGVFAEEAIERGSLIGEYTGIVREARDIEVPLSADDFGKDDRYETDYAWDYPDCFADVPLEIDASAAGNELRFVNHSFNPNLEVEHTVVDGRWVVFFVAGSDIAPGEQLFVDYGEEYWTGGYRTLVLA